MQKTQIGLTHGSKQIQANNKNRVKISSVTTK